jgi:hypothetical protein
MKEQREMMEETKNKSHESRRKYFQDFFQHPAPIIHQIFSI